MRKWWILIVLIIIGFIGYNYLYKSHRNIENETPTYVVSVKSIINEFLENPTESENKYLNKTIEINGVVTELGTNDIILDNAVFCQFNKQIIQNLRINDSLSVKGRCIGYDSLLEQVKLDQCIVVVSE